MPDYAAMYKRMFQSQTQAIEILQKAQCARKGGYIAVRGAIEILPLASSRSRYHVTVNPCGQGSREKQPLHPVIPRLTLKGKPEGNHSMSEYAKRPSFTGVGAEG